MKEEIKLKKYHAPVWNEPIIMEMSEKGERGILLPQVEEGIKKEVGIVENIIPKDLRKLNLPQLPELSQPQILRHYLRLSQETLGADTNISFGLGTCTMKYNPKINEVLAGLPQVGDVHPFQNNDTIQGILEIIYRLDLICREISGMDQFTFQPGAGSHAIFTHTCILRKYHKLRGEPKTRNEIITTIFSHPVNVACARTAGYKVITLMPDENGCPDLDALRSVCSEKTAGLLITNPEDTGIYNPNIKQFVDAVHKVGGLCFYDQANLNGIIGITRAKEAGFDACHFNLHKTFGTPHGCMGPGSGAYGVTKELSKFLPCPLVEFDGKKYRLKCNEKFSIGKIREFLGNFSVVLKAYAWVMSLGAEGLKEVAQISVLNNNYLEKLLLDIPGITKPYAEGRSRLEQTRFSLEKIKQDTGVGTVDIKNRIVDFGITTYFASHVPWIVPEPMTPEPCESFSKKDIEYWAAVIKRISNEAYSDPSVVKTAPHNSSSKRIIDANRIDDNPEEWVLSWGDYIKRKANK